MMIIVISISVRIFEIIKYIYYGSETSWDALRWDFSESEIEIFWFTKIYQDIKRKSEYIKRNEWKSTAAYIPMKHQT